METICTPLLAILERCIGPLHSTGVSQHQMRRSVCLSGWCALMFARCFEIILTPGQVRVKASKALCLQNPNIANVAAEVMNKYD